MKKTMQIKQWDIYIFIINYHACTQHQPVLDNLSSSESKDFDMKIAIFLEICKLCKKYKIYPGCLKWIIECNQVGYMYNIFNSWCNTYAIHL